MTAKEKAKKLVDKMKLKKDVIDENNYWSANEFGAKECALICVNEMEGVSFSFFGQDKNFTLYLLELREEIIKL
jgi:hypothetical protein